MAGPYSFFTTTQDTLASVMAVSATTCTLTSGNFGTPARKVILTVDANVSAKRADYECTITNTSVTAMVRLNGPDVAHSAGAVVWCSFVDDHADELQQFTIDGWRPTGVVATYLSATTFTLAGDWTAVLSKGDKLKLTNTTTKYFYVIDTSVAASVTTVTVTGGSDYTLASAAITGVSYSKAASPSGFPGWFNYSAIPTGGLTSIGNGTSYGRFTIAAGRAILETNFQAGTTTAFNTPSFKIPLPVTARSAVYTGEVNRLGGVYMFDYSASVTNSGNAVVFTSDYNNIVIYVQSAGIATGLVPFTWANQDIIATNISYLI